MNTDNIKKYFIQTFGCQANIRDSQAMAGTLEGLGFSHTKNYKDADVIIINTCSVRQKSEDKVYGWGMKIGYTIKDPEQKFKIEKSKKKNEKLSKRPGTKKQVVFVTGCMVGSAKGERTRYKMDFLKKKITWADYFLAPEEESEIPMILAREKLLDEWALKTIQKPQNDIDKNGNKIEINPKLENNTEWAYVNVSTGCDNFCTFCVVPYARGEEKSRSKQEIIDEIKHLVERGYTNIMLVGQNVNSWGLDREAKFKLRAGSEHKIPFASLLREVHKIKEVSKISFISSNPFDFTKDLIQTLKLPKIDRYLHMAVQSGNNEILKKMNRRHTIEEFKELVTNIKKEVPDMTFGTDIIVGFPGETEDQFMDTVNLFKWMKFNVAFISIYSAREGTPASKHFKDDVTKKEKQKRHAKLMKIWKESLV